MTTIIGTIESEKDKDTFDKDLKVASEEYNKSGADKLKMIEEFAGTFELKPPSATVAAASLPAPPPPSATSTLSSTNVAALDAAAPVVPVPVVPAPVVPVPDAKADAKAKAEAEVYKQMSLNDVREEDVREVGGAPRTRRKRYVKRKTLMRKLMRKRRQK